MNPQQDSSIVGASVPYQKLLERIPQLAWLMTRQGKILTANQRWAKYLGQADPQRQVRSMSFGASMPQSGSANDENLPQTFAEILYEDERDRFVRAWAAAKMAEEPLEIKLQLKSGLGQWEWFQVELELDRDGFGETIWLGTAMRLGGEGATPAHEQSDQFLEALLDGASDGIVACDADGRLVLFNRMAQMFHGLPPEPVEPEEWASYYALYDADGIRILAKSEIPLFRALEGESVVSQEMTIKPKQGEARSLLANGTAIYATTGEKLGAVALMRDITDYKQVMTALQDSERKFRAMFDSTPQLMGLLLPDGTVVEMNRAALEFVELTAEAARGLPFGGAPCWSYSPAIQQQLQESIARAAQGEIIRYEVDLMGSLGLVPIAFSLTPILNELRDEVILLIVEGWDLTQIKQAKTERLRAQLHSERLAMAMRVAKAAAWNWDLRNQQMLWTPEFEAIFDYEVGSTQQVYSEWLARVHPDDRAEAEGKWQDTTCHKLPEFRSEYRIVWRDGQIRWIDMVGELHLDEQGNIQSMSGLIYDITERKRNEAALRHSEEFTRRILESNQDCIKVIDLEGHILYMNDGGQILMEIDNFAPARMQWLELWQGSECESAIAAFATALAGRVSRFDGYCATAKGTPKWWEVIVTPIFNEGGDVEQVLSVSRDITDRKQLESIAIAQTAELQDLNHSLLLAQQHSAARNEDLDRFAYIVSHDLKAPLRAIAHLSSWIEEDLGSQIPAQNQQQFHLLRQRTERMAALIDGLLRYSRLGREELAVELVDVAQLIAETIDSLDPPGCFQIEILSPMPTFTTKRILLGQIFANLLSNAIKHHDSPNGRVEISVEDLGDRYEFSIADDGPGIPEGEARKRIFEIFQTLKSKDSAENTGIGLALIQKIIEDEGGQIRLDGDRPHGACFCFTWLKSDVTLKLTQEA